MENEQLKNVFAFSNPMQIGQSDASTQTRNFSGVAYTGDVIKSHWYWGSVIFDLASISMPERCAALIDHDSGKRCGVITQYAIDNATGLSISGRLLSNENGQAVAQDSDDGFPWQMSVRIEPSRVEELQSGTSTVVNGRTVTGPINIFRDSKIVEVSFTATGWDANTSAVALSRTTPERKEMNLTQELQDKVAELKKANEALAQQFAAASEALKKSNEQLLAFNKKQRMTEIKGLFEKAGLAFREDNPQAVSLANLNEEAYQASKSMIEAAVPAIKGNLSIFSHVATEDNTNKEALSGPDTGGALLKHAEQKAKQFKKEFSKQ